MSAPRGLPERVWVVVRPSGERHLIDKEPLGGMVEWAKGLDATVLEYTFSKLVHVPPPKKKKESR